MLVRKHLLTSLTLRKDGLSSLKALIQEGAFADIIIVNGDPTKDVRLLMDADKNIDFIMKKPPFDRKLAAG